MMADYTELVKALRCLRIDFHAHEAADAIEELQRQIDAWVEPERKALIKSIPRWIPVTERLPEPYTNVLLCGGAEFYTGYMHSDKRFTVNASHFPDRPTHWMLLPEPPKEET